MRYRAFRSVAAILSILLLTGVPAQAGPIVVSDVIQVLSNYQNPPNLYLRSVSQNSTSLASRLKGSLKQSAMDRSLQIADASISGPIAPTSDSLLAGVAMDSDPQTIDVISQGDVEGTICDCGEITVPGGGWPKWPLLFLAAIPFFFIHDCEDCEQLPPPSTPPPPSHFPEPASLLLFGTGLAAFGAGLRRRYSRSQVKAQIRATRGDA